MMSSRKGFRCAALSSVLVSKEVVRRLDRFRLHENNIKSYLPRTIPTDSKFLPLIQQWLSHQLPEYVPISPMFQSVGKPRTNIIPDAPKRPCPRSQCCFRCVLTSTLGIECSRKMPGYPVAYTSVAWLFDVDLIISRLKGTL